MRYDLRSVTHWVLGSTVFVQLLLLSGIITAYTQEYVAVDSNGFSSEVVAVTPDSFQGNTFINLSPGLVDVLQIAGIVGFLLVCGLACYQARTGLLVGLIGGIVAWNVLFDAALYSNQDYALPYLCLAPVVGLILVPVLDRFGITAYRRTPAVPPRSMTRPTREELIDHPEEAEQLPS